MLRPLSGRRYACARHLGTHQAVVQMEFRTEALGRFALEVGRARLRLEQYPDPLVTQV